jgi:hypothetical protein
MSYIYTFYIYRVNNEEYNLNIKTDEYNLNNLNIKTDEYNLNIHR